MEKFLHVLGDNLGYTIVAIIAIIVFAVASDGNLVAGLITAFSAVVAYACIVALVSAYKDAPDVKTKSSPKKKRKK